MWFPAWFIFARLFWRTRETLVKQPHGPAQHGLTILMINLEYCKWTRGQYHNCKWSGWCCRQVTSGHNIDYCQIPNIRCTLVGNNFFTSQMKLEHRLLALLQPHLHSRLKPGFNGLGKENCKTRLETVKFLDSVSYIRDLTVCRINWSLSSETEHFNCLCHLNIRKW